MSDTILTTILTTKFPTEFPKKLTTKPSAILQGPLGHRKVKKYFHPFDHSALKVCKALTSQDARTSFRGTKV